MTFRLAFVLLVLVPLTGFGGSVSEVYLVSIESIQPAGAGYSRAGAGVGAVVGGVALSQSFADAGRKERRLATAAGVVAGAFVGAVVGDRGGRSRIVFRNVRSGNLWATEQAPDGLRVGELAYCLVDRGGGVRLVPAAGGAR